MGSELPKVKGSFSSVVVDSCQICGNRDLKSVLFVGYLPPVNKMRRIGAPAIEQISYPAELLFCPSCTLAQLGLVVDPQILFPSEYPYTSSTTKVLRDNFAELYQDCAAVLSLEKNDLVIDIGSNDGNLLSNFVGKHRVLGITPEEIGKQAIQKGIPTILDYFTPVVVDRVLKEHGQAKMITATNVFAHIEHVNDVVAQIIRLMPPKGVFVSESHYLMPLLATLQYDTIYHEHLRYYSLHSLQFLLERHGLQIVRAKEIPTHGGSIRVYAAKKGDYPVDSSVEKLLAKERQSVVSLPQFAKFANDVALSKERLHAIVGKIKEEGKRIWGISAPSRASTLINYVGLDAGIVDAVVEVQGSYKIGYYIPGTTIPIIDEAQLFTQQPEYALLFSWHIADELIPKLIAKGFRGKFIVPLPEPRIVSA